MAEVVYSALAKNFQREHWNSRSLRRASVEAILSYQSLTPHQLYPVMR